MSTEQVLNLIDCLGGDRISSRDVAATGCLLEPGPQEPRPQQQQVAW